MVERDSRPTLNGGSLAAKVFILEPRSWIDSPWHPCLVVTVDAEAGPNRFQQPLMASRNSAGLVAEF